MAVVLLEHLQEEVGLSVWRCCYCQGMFIDADEHPDLNRFDQAFIKGIEPQSYWLAPDEISCASCAQTRGIPSAD